MTRIYKDYIYVNYVQKCHINFSLLSQWTSFNVFSSTAADSVIKENTAGVVWRQEGEAIMK